MAYVEFACFAAGLVAIVMGYRRDKRNLLLVGALAWLLAGGLGDFTRGFQEGFSSAMPRHGSSQ